MAEIEGEFSMHQAGTGKVVEQIGFGIAQGMGDDGKLGWETPAILLRYWDMADWEPGDDIPEEFATEDLYEAAYLIKHQAMRELLILIDEGREDLTRLGIVIDTQEEG